MHLLYMLCIIFLFGFKPPSNVLLIQSFPIVYTCVTAAFPTNLWLFLVLWAIMSIGPALRPAFPRVLGTSDRSQTCIRVFSTLGLVGGEGGRGDSLSLGTSILERSWGYPEILSLLAFFPPGHFPQSLEGIYHSIYHNFFYQSLCVLNSQLTLITYWLAPGDL